MKHNRPASAKLQVVGELRVNSVDMTSNSVSNAGLQVLRGSSHSFDAFLPSVQAGGPKMNATKHSGRLPSFRDRQGRTDVAQPIWR